MDESKIMRLESVTNWHYGTRPNKPCYPIGVIIKKIPIIWISILILRVSLTSSPVKHGIQNLDKTVSSTVDGYDIVYVRMLYANHSVSEQRTEGVERCRAPALLVVLYASWARYNRLALLMQQNREWKKDGTKQWFVQPLSIFLSP